MVRAEALEDEVPQDNAKGKSPLIELVRGLAEPLIEDSGRQEFAERLQELFGGEGGAQRVGGRNGWRFCLRGASLLLGLRLGADMMIKDDSKKHLTHINPLIFFCAMLPLSASHQNAQSIQFRVHSMTRSLHYSNTPFLHLSQISATPIFPMTEHKIPMAFNNFLRQDGANQSGSFELR
jgi:hypothetical protein